ncbi:DUF6053 domain-containing protein [Lysobacter enzymogenes]|uniref:DUF6053 domain-containing protein n=1 Tax=Lysobacter enzymogenes TaxID=69 RepID=UPI003D18F393
MKVPRGGNKSVGPEGPPTKERPSHKERAAVVGGPSGPTLCDQLAASRAARSHGAPLTRPRRLRCSTAPRPP